MTFLFYANDSMRGICASCGGGVQKPGDKSATWEKEFSEISSIFIPAKEILSNSFNLTAAVEKDNVRFNDTYIDIINSAKVDISVGRNSSDRDNHLKAIEKIIDGTVFYDSKKDEFYLKKGNSKQEFNLVAEGYGECLTL